MTTFAPTLEQQAALDAFATGDDMVIEAGAVTRAKEVLDCSGLSWIDAVECAA
jgi:hypothetical protein